MSFGLGQVTHTLCLCRRCQVHCPLLSNFSAWKWFKARGMPSSKGTDWAINLRPLFCTCTVHHYTIRWGNVSMANLRKLEVIDQLTKIWAQIQLTFCIILPIFAEGSFDQLHFTLAKHGDVAPRWVYSWELWHSGSSPECWLREVEPNHINCHPSTGY